jgi:hypothetical protein
LPHLARRLDDQRVALDRDLDAAVKAALIDDRFGDPNALRIADADQFGLHPAASSIVIIL